MNIIEFKEKAEIFSLIHLINESFQTIHDEFRIERLINRDIIEKMVIKGFKFFVAIDSGNPVGCVALLKVSEKKIKIERLSVLLDYRHSGIGSQFLDLATTFAKELECSKIILGHVYENIQLRDWYIKHGFICKRVKKIKKSSLKICFLEKLIEL